MKCTHWGTLWTLSWPTKGRTCEKTQFLNVIHSGLSQVKSPSISPKRMWFRTIGLKSRPITQLVKNRLIHEKLRYFKWKVYASTHFKMITNAFKKNLENLLLVTFDFVNNWSLRHFLDVWGLVLVILKDLPIGEMQTILFFATQNCQTALTTQCSFRWQFFCQGIWNKRSSRIGS